MYQNAYVTSIGPLLHGCPSCVGAGYVWPAVIANWDYYVGYNEVFATFPVIANNGRAWAIQIVKYLYFYMKITSVSKPLNDEIGYGKVTVDS